MPIISQSARATEHVGSTGSAEPCLTTALDTSPQRCCPPWRNGYSSF